MRELHVSLDYTAKCWTVAHYVDGSADPEVVELFGTHVLPSPFGLTALWSDVSASLSRLNPGVALVRL